MLLLLLSSLSLSRLEAAGLLERRLLVCVMRQRESERERERERERASEREGARGGGVHGEAGAILCRCPSRSGSASGGLLQLRFSRGVYSYAFMRTHQL